MQILKALALDRLGRHDEALALCEEVASHFCIIKNYRDSSVGGEIESRFSRRYNSVNHVDGVSCEWERFAVMLTLWMTDNPFVSFERNCNL